MIDQERIVKNFLELAQIDSISREERPLADRLIAELKELGCEIQEDRTGEEIGGTAGNLIADFPGSSIFPTLLLSAHMDRVEPGRGIVPAVDGNEIFSEGETILAGDDLAGVVVILELLRHIREEGLETGRLKIVFTVAEEVGLLGAKHLDTAVLNDCYFGLVLDSGSRVGSIVNRGPSQIKFKALIRGKAAHAGVAPDRGINALKIASRAISGMKLGRIDEQTTANIGVIRGGRATNIVPDLVELEGEARSHSEESLKNQQDHMEGVVEEAAAHYHGQAEVEVTRLYNSFSLDEKSTRLRMVWDAVEETGLESCFLASGGGSDANIFNQNGLPTVNLGIGVENAHSTEERVMIDSLVNLTSLVMEIIRRSQSSRYREIERLKLL